MNAWWWGFVTGNLCWLAFLTFEWYAGVLTITFIWPWAR